MDRVPGPGWACYKFESFSFSWLSRWMNRGRKRSRSGAWWGGAPTLQGGWLERVWVKHAEESWLGVNETSKVWGDPQGNTWWKGKVLEAWLLGAGEGAESQGRRMAFGRGTDGLQGASACAAPHALNALCISLRQPGRTPSTAWSLLSSQASWKSGSNW